MFFDELIRGFNKVLCNPALRDEVHYGEKQEGLVRCAMVRCLRVPVPSPVGPEFSEHLEVFLKHRPVSHQRVRQVCDGPFFSWLLI